MDYTNIQSLSCFYLEDRGWVLSFSQIRNGIQFELDLVLTERHPDWRQPPANEQYCYRRAVLKLPDLKTAEWRLSTVAPAKDASGEIDFGNIDSFRIVDGRYELRGSWGSLAASCGIPTVQHIA